MTQPTIAEPSDFSQESEKINVADARYRAPFRRSATYEFAGTPVVRLTLTDAELSAGAVLFGVVGLMGLVELVSGQALALGFTNRQITRTRRTVSGAIGTMSLAIASIAGFTLARRYAATLTEQLFYESISSALSSERDYADLLVGVYPC